MKTSESLKHIAPALKRAQAKMATAKKDSSNPFFKSKYADLNAIREVVLPALNEEGISVLQPINGDELETVLLHESGEFFASSSKIVVSKQNDPQAYGSAISYTRRYDLQSIVCAGAEDDDAESVMRPKGDAGRKSVTKTTRSTVEDF